MDSKERFLEVHDKYLNELDNAYKNAETSDLTKYFHTTYHGYFGTRQNNKAEFYDLNGALDGIIQTGRALSDITSRCVNRHVRMPSEQDAVVFYEKSMNHAKGVSYAYLIEVWREIDGTWLLIRETVELA